MAWEGTGKRAEQGGAPYRPGGWIAREGTEQRGRRRRRGPDQQLRHSTAAGEWAQQAGNHTRSQAARRGGTAAQPHSTAQHSTAQHSTAQHSTRKERRYRFPGNQIKTTGRGGRAGGEPRAATRHRDVGGGAIRNEAGRQPPPRNARAAARLPHSPPPARHVSLAHRLLCHLTGQLLRLGAGLPLPLGEVVVGRDAGEALAGRRAGAGAGAASCITPKHRQQSATERKPPDQARTGSNRGSSVTHRGRRRR